MMALEVTIVAFKDNLRRLRKAAGFLQSELAERLGVSKSTVSMWETGERTPTLETLEAIADVLNVSMAELWGTAPLPVAMDGSGLTAEEMELIEAFRAASPEKRAALLILAKST